MTRIYRQNITWNKFVTDFNQRNLKIVSKMPPYWVWNQRYLKRPTLSGVPTTQNRFLTNKNNASGEKIFVCNFRLCWLQGVYWHQTNNWKWDLKRSVFSNSYFLMIIKQVNYLSQKQWWIKMMMLNRKYGTYFDIHYALHSILEENKLRPMK